MVEAFNRNIAAGAVAGEINPNEEYERPKVHYVCGGKSSDLVACDILLLT